ncbi:MAG: HAD-IB family phosphatase [Verrucomicrobiaceae bacterium]
MKKIIAFDCDSTLSAIEGVDELARLAGPEAFQKVEDLTNQAMNGEIAIEEVFAKRLELINPTRQQCEDIGQMYLDQIEPTAKETIAALQADGWECLIISGGFAPCIEALAKVLNISRIEAVPLNFHPDGSYAGFDSDYPTTRNGGKPELIEAIKKESSPDQIVMVGDGVSDFETQPIVDHFFAYTGFVAREKVTRNAQHIITSLAEIPPILG